MAKFTKLSFCQKFLFLASIFYVSLFCKAKNQIVFHQKMWYNLFPYKGGWGRIKIWTPEKIAVIVLKFEQCGFTKE